LLRRLEARRLHDPALHPRAAARGVPDLFHLRQPLVREHVLVHAREAGELRLPQVPAHHLRWMGRIALYADGREGPGHGRERYDLRALRHVTNAPREIGVADVDGPAVRRGEGDPLAVRCPREIARVAIEA